MMYHPTLDKLQQLKLTGMLHALQEQEAIPDVRAMPFEERLGLMVDRELTERGNRRMQTRLRMAKLKQGAALEDIDFKSARSLDRSLIMKLADCEWVKSHLNVLVTGVTGVGKTWLGRLPGDINVTSKNGSFHFPIVTCILISLVLTILSWLFRR